MLTTGRCLLATVPTNAILVNIVSSGTLSKRRENHQHQMDKLPECSFVLYFPYVHFTNLPQIGADVTNIFNRMMYYRYPSSSGDCYCNYCVIISKLSSLIGVVTAGWQGYGYGL